MQLAARSDCARLVSENKHPRPCVGKNLLQAAPVLDAIQQEPHACGLTLDSTKSMRMSKLQ